MHYRGSYESVAGRGTLNQPIKPQTKTSLSRYMHAVVLCADLSTLLTCRKEEKSEKDGGDGGDVDDDSRDVGGERGWFCPAGQTGHCVWGGTKWDKERSGSTRSRSRSRSSRRRPVANTQRPGYRSAAFCLVAGAHQQGSSCVGDRKFGHVRGAGAGSDIARQTYKIKGHQAAGGGCE